MDYADYEGKDVLVFAGSPRERVDTFRFYENNSRPESYGFDIAEKLKAAGANVTVVTRLREDEIESTQDMLDAAKGNNYDLVLQLANIPSIKCPAPATRKLQKTDDGDSAQMFKISGNVDVEKELARIFPDTEIAGYNKFQEWFGGIAEIAHAAKAVDSVSETEGKPFVRNIGKLIGKKIVVNCARTEEVITEFGDYITNPFQGRQGQAIAIELARMGADVTLVTGSTVLPDLEHDRIKTIHVKTANEMCEACVAQLPADAFVGSAAIADFGVETKLSAKLTAGEEASLEMVENANTIGTIAKHEMRPKAVVSFAAQSPETILDYAPKKREKLGVDLTVANPIGPDTAAAKNPNMNQVYFITANGIDESPVIPKTEVAKQIAGKIADLLKFKSEGIEKGNGGQKWER